MFLTGLMRAVKAGMSGWRCSHIGCQITRPLANRKVRSDSYLKNKSMLLVALICLLNQVSNASKHQAYCLMHEMIVLVLFFDFFWVYYGNKNNISFCLTGGQNVKSQEGCSLILLSVCTTDQSPYTSLVMGVLKGKNKYTVDWIFRYLISASFFVHL